MAQQRGRSPAGMGGAESQSNPYEIELLIQKVKEPGFTFSKLKPEDYAPLHRFAYHVAVVERTDRTQGRRKKTETRIKITQLRKFFAEVKRLERGLKGRGENEALDDSFYAKLYPLHPLLAYAKGRDHIDKHFFEFMRSSLTREKLPTVKDFLTFSDFLTAILAYSKYAGKQEGQE
jgi:CRISPR type III-A-associated protein Csm2